MKVFPWIFFLFFSLFILESSVFVREKESEWERQDRQALLTGSSHAMILIPQSSSSTGSWVGVHLVCLQVKLRSEHTDSHVTSSTADQYTTACTKTWMHAPIQEFFSYYPYYHYCQRTHITRETEGGKRKRRKASPPVGQGHTSISCGQLCGFQPTP